MKTNETFHCWACESQLHSMHEIAQGVCDSCKAAIIRKNQLPLMRHDLLSLINAARIFTPNTNQLRKIYRNHYHF